MFEEERVRIAKHLGEWVEDIQHCGSTAVPGLAAKPVIDIYVALRPDSDTDRCIAAMEAAGYQYRGKGLGFRGDHLFIRRTAKPAPGQDRRDGDPRGRTTSTCVTSSNPEWQRHILFRDYLRRDETVAKRYGDAEKGPR